MFKKILLAFLGLAFLVLTTMALSIGAWVLGGCPVIKTPLAFEIQTPESAGTLERLRINVACLPVSIFQVIHPPRTPRQ